MVGMGFSLDEFLTDDIKSNKPDDLETVYYLFWENGFSLKDVDELPLPYIFGILKTHNWLKEQEKIEYEKSSKRK